MSWTAVRDDSRYLRIGQGLRGFSQRMCVRITKSQ
jgi:hypothetical protein